MLTVMVTEAGGPAAVGLIKSLKKYSSDIQILAVDADPSASGIHISDHGHTVPYASDERYIDKILSLIKEYGVNLILPTGEHDLYKLSENKKRLESLGCSIFISDKEVIETCQNKFKFYQALKHTDIPVPMTFQNKMIVKPNRGSGSRGIEILDLDEKVIQEYLPGREYTVDVFCNMSSQIVNHVIRERLATKAGISTKGRVVLDENISSIIRKMVEHLSLKGPVCIQLKEDDTGRPFVIECNPRLGGGTYICTLAGVNYAELYIDILQKRDNTHRSPQEITVVRYFEEIIL